MKILLVEDNAGDARLMVEALKSLNLPHRLQVFQTGESALDYLYRRNSNRNAIRPDIILLDLHLPKMSGKDVLSILKSDEDLKIIPVIILSASASDHDRLECYRLHANACLTKPQLLDDFILTIQTVSEFWLKNVKLPYQLQI